MKDDIFELPRKIWNHDWSWLASLSTDYELTMWPAPRWLDSSLGRALHRSRISHGFESRCMYSVNLTAAISEQRIQSFISKTLQAINYLLTSNDRSFREHSKPRSCRLTSLALIEYGVGCGLRFSRKDHSWLMITTKLECLADKKYRPEISTMRSECLQSVEQAWFIKEFSLHIDWKCSNISTTTNWKGTLKLPTFDYWIPTWRFAHGWCSQ